MSSSEISCKEAVDSAGNIVDLTDIQWMTKVRLPYVNIREIYRYIQDEVVLEMLPSSTKVLLRVRCTDNHETNFT